MNWAGDNKLAMTRRPVDPNWPKIESGRPMVTPHIPWKFHANRSSRFLVILLTKKQTNKQRNKERNRAKTIPRPGMTGDGVMTEAKLCTNWNWIDYKYWNITDARHWEQSTWDKLFANMYALLLYCSKKSTKQKAPTAETPMPTAKTLAGYFRVYHLNCYYGWCFGFVVVNKLSVTWANSNFQCTVTVTTLLSPPSEWSEWWRYCFCSMCVCVCVQWTSQSDQLKRLKLRTSNLTCVFLGTVGTWPLKIFPKGGMARVA